LVAAIVGVAVEDEYEGAVADHFEGWPGFGHSSTGGWYNCYGGGCCTFFVNVYISFLYCISKPDGDAFFD